VAGVFAAGAAMIRRDRREAPGVSAKLTDRLQRIARSAGSYDSAGRPFVGGLHNDSGNTAGY